MYLLDTNVVSMLDPRRHSHAPQLIVWINRNFPHLFLSVMTATEMEAGILKLKRKGNTKRANDLSGLLQGIVDDFGERILPVDLETARHVARISELVHKRQIDLPDVIIAATTARNGLTLLTHNLTDFGSLGIRAIDPFLQLPPDVP